MRWISVVLAASAFAAALIGSQTTRSLGARIGDLEVALESLQARKRDLAGAISRCENEPLAGLVPVEGVTRNPTGECECPEVVACATASQREASGEETREARVAANLANQIRRAFDESELDEATRAEAIDLLLRIRALRALQGGRDVDDHTPPALRDALVDAQREFASLTGMGVAAFLRTIDVREEPRSLEAHEARDVLPREERMRFADEAARRLGITDPGSLEIFEDEEWRP